MSYPRVLVACEYSGTVREAFRAKGLDAWSCDLLPATDGSPFHIQGNLFEVIEQHGPFDLLIAHPPCTYLCSSGLHWNGRVEGRQAKTEQALEFVRQLMTLDVPMIAIENPVGCISTRIDAREYGFASKGATQYVQPYDFGDDASKRTGLWLKNLPKIIPTDRVAGRIVTRQDGSQVERWANQTDSGQNALGPSEDRWKARSTTYMGIASAMADQWSDQISKAA